MTAGGLRDGTNRVSARAATPIPSPARRSCRQPVAHGHEGQFINRISVLATVPKPGADVGKGTGRRAETAKTTGNRPLASDVHVIAQGPVL
ncbi:MAG: hypothetical protein R3F55_04725 [Alphaproteobacteria bacterium]